MKVNAYVYVLKGGASVLLRPGDTVPDGVTVTNPAVIDADSAEETPADKAPADKAPADETPEVTEDEAPAEPAPAPRKRTAKKAAPASE